MNVLTGLLQAVSPLPDGDLADRLNYCYTTVGLVIASAFISGWSFVGSPIQCWFPAYYKGWWMEYALDYCFVQNTYFVPFHDVPVTNAFDFAQHVVPIPTNTTQRDEREIGYYQWVPFILAMQALMFYLPVVLWRAIYESSGFKVRAICDTCAVSSNMDEGERKKNMQTVAGFLVYEHTVSSTMGSKARRISQGGYVVAVYLVTKFLYLLNSLLQFVLLKNMLGVGSYLWGLDVFQDLIVGKEWPQTGNFPRVTMCDFSVRVLGNLHRHSVQCVLMINMFNEKIFIALWFWLCFMLVVSLCSFIYWLFTASTTRVGRQIVNSYIHKIDPEVSRSLHKKSMLDEFVTEKLRPDGVFLVRLVASNSGDMVACSLLQTLWEDFKKSRASRPPPYTEPLLVGKPDIEESDL